MNGKSRETSKTSKYSLPGPRLDLRVWDEYSLSRLKLLLERQEGSERKVLVSGVKY